MSLDLRNSLIAATKQRPSSVNAFRVVSYNILHSGYLNDKTSATAKEVGHYNRDGAKHLSTAHRCKLVREELEAYGADIVLLQEFGLAGDDHDGKEYAKLYDYLEEKLGYKCEFFKKTGLSSEGVLVAYKKRRFTAAGAPKQIPLSATRLSGGESGIINCKKAVLSEEVADLKKASSVLGVCLLRDNANPQRLLVVGNTHLYSSPDAHGARGIQALMASHALERECRAASDMLDKESQGLVSIDRLVDPVNAHLASALKTLGHHRLSKLQVCTIPYLLNDTNVLRIGAAADLAANGSCYLSGVLPLLSSIANLAADEDKVKEEPGLLGVLIVEATLHAKLKDLLCRVLAELRKEVAEGDMALPAISVCALSDDEASSSDAQLRSASIIIGTASQVKNMCFEGHVAFEDSLLFVSAAACGGGEKVLRETMEAVSELRKGCDSFTLLVDVDDPKSLFQAKKQCFNVDDSDAVCVRDNSDDAPKLLFGQGEGGAYSENYYALDEGEGEDASGVFVILGGDFNCAPGGHAHSATLSAAFDGRKFGKPSLRLKDVHAGYGDMSQYATTVTNSYAGIVDYIFYGCGEGDSAAQSLTLVSAVPMANISEAPIPNENFPSDHFAVIADLSF